MSIEMPEFTQRLATVSKDRYKIKFLEDGYPGKEFGNNVVPHPIYGIYVIRDYLFQYKKTKKTIYINAAIKVANAAIERMDIFKGSLVFWYKKESCLNPSDRDYYSGLTQSYYAEAFANIFDLTSDQKYYKAAQDVYNSLKISVSEGGVFSNTLNGPSIQEYPANPNGYILNGWLSSLLAIKNYADILDNTEATSFWKANLSTITKLLPLYDAPNFMNSRYTLNGPTTIKISSNINNIELIKSSIVVPDEGIYPLLDSGPSVSKNKLTISSIHSGNIDSSSVTQKEKKFFLKNNKAFFDVLLSRYSYPKENQISISLLSPYKGTLQLYIAQPQYFPKKVIKPNNYILLKEISLIKGRNDIKFNIPWKYLESIGTPTRFKQFESKWYNVYHFIHINKLEYFYTITNDSTILEYITKWKDYVKKWSEHPLYKDMETNPYKSN